MKDNLDQLVWLRVFGSEEEKKQASQEIRKLASKKGIWPASTCDFYLARGKGEVPCDFTVPAINIRGLTFEVAQALFKVALEKNVSAFIFEIARSEIGYTDQSPQEYAEVILAAGLKTGFTGPLFLQGDHYQVSRSKPQEGEIKEIKELIKESLEAGFYNIDIDASTLVDYSQKEITDQQKENFQVTAQLAEFTRQLQDSGVTVSLGGEIGHIGGKNSTEEELEVFMQGFKNKFPSQMTGLSKISVQTGSHHGGVILPDGKLANVAIDFGVLKKLAKMAREYGMAGTVQHGASTLPDKYFAQFVESEAVEVHLATGFQNLIFDHQLFPKDLLKKIYQWLDEKLGSQRQAGQTDKQFHYKLRKKAWGAFKKEIWSLPEESKKAIIKDLKERFAFIFEELNVVDSLQLVSSFTKKQ